MAKEEKKVRLPAGQLPERQSVCAKIAPPWFALLDVYLSGCPSTISGLALLLAKGAG